MTKNLLCRAVCRGAMLIVFPFSSIGSDKDAENEVEFLFAGAFCSTGANQVKSVLKGLDGVKRVTSKWQTAPESLSQLMVRFDPALISENKITQTASAYGWAFHENEETVILALEKYKTPSLFNKESVQTYSGSVKNVMCGSAVNKVKSRFAYFGCIRDLKIKKGQPHSSISFEFDAGEASIKSLKDDLKILGIQLIDSRSE